MPGLCGVSQPPDRHARYFRIMVKILVDNLHLTAVYPAQHLQLLWRSSGGMKGRQAVPHTHIFVVIMVIAMV